MNFHASFIFMVCTRCPQSSPPMLDDLLDEWNAEHPHQHVPDAFALPEVPLLKTPGLDLLMREGTEIEPDRLEKFLFSSKEAFRQDLLALLDFAATRYPDYRDIDAAHGLSRAQISFPLHALMLRTALNAPGVLADLEPFLLRPAEEIHFWMEDRLAHVLWLPFYKALPAEIDRVERMVLAPSAAIEVRLAAVSALGQSLLQDQFRLHLYVPAFERCLQAAAHAHADAQAPRVAGALIREAVNARQQAVLPAIRAALAEGRVDTSACGLLPEIEQGMSGLVNSWARMEAMDIFALYSFLERSEKVEHTETKAGAMLQIGRPKAGKGQPQGRSFAPPKASPAKPAQPQVGRNDLCPCGSGLKFKKCHGK
jgi:SEC-C motif